MRIDQPEGVALKKTVAPIQSLTMRFYPSEREQAGVLKKIGLVVKRDVKARQKADELHGWLEKRNIEVIRKESPPPGRKLSMNETQHAPGNLFCIFVLGGDGTFLSAVRWIGEQHIPILGVKFGEVGFLAEISEEKLFTIAQFVLDDHFKTTPRMRLYTEVRRNGDIYVRETVLNDLVINKGALARLGSIRTNIDDHYLTTYRADGLIVATPTGSTAYSLAAGGPIIHPEVPGIILTPICPFTLTNRPLIVPDSVTIRLQLAEESSDIMVTFDGQAGLEIDEKDSIIVKKSDHSIQMITLPETLYYDVLKEKLRWSGGRA